MIADLNETDGDPFRDKVFDVCICGAGVAGITLALRLSRHLSVLLLEAGGKEYSERSQEVYGGRSVGRDYFDLRATRLRYLGGSSNHWSGWCRPLDPVDFRQKWYAAFTGWPIRIEDLTQYLAEARDVLDIHAQESPEVDDSFRIISTEISRAGDFRSIEFEWSTPPARIGEKFLPRLDSAQNVICYLNANVVDIHLMDNKATVDRVEVHNYSGNAFHADVRCLVLAAGGIENPRILLNSHTQAEKGIGNQHDNVGRFFSEHPHHVVGEFIVADDVRERLPRHWRRWFDAYEFFSPTERCMYENEILNIGLRLQHYTREPGTFKERLKRIICYSELAESAYEGLSQEEIPCLDRRHVEGVLRCASEQAPNPSSRVRLDSDIDRFGNRKVAIDWQLSEMDKRTIRVATFRFGETLANLNLGRLRVVDWLLTGDDDLNLPGLGQDELAGNHHLCTTRMANAPRDGVVDSHQRVFDTDNLYIVGSSVFPTGGHSNPTLTIVQMTLRLADHLNRVMPKSNPQVLPGC